MILSRDAILQADDLPRELVAMPEWGGSVYVRGLNGSERDRLEASLTTQKGKDPQELYRDFSARLVAMCVVDEAGKSLLQEGDVPLLGRKSAVTLRRIVEVAQRLSGVSEADVKELTKN